MKLPMTASAPSTPTDQRTEYLPELTAECKRLGLDLQLSDDPATDLPEIKVINGRRTVIARADELGVARDDVRAIGRCTTCNSELDDTAVLYAPANAVPGYGGIKDMTGADVKICRPCVEASGLPLTAAQRGPQWMAKYSCPFDCINDHAAPFPPEWHAAARVETQMRDVDVNYSARENDRVPFLGAQVVVTNDRAQAYGRRTSVWLDYGRSLGELTPEQARDALKAMRWFVERFEAVIDYAEKTSADDFDGDPEIARLDSEATDRRIRAVNEARAEKTEARA
ncbi:hypothetical protein [Streptomyces phaeochromogenes]